MKRIGFIQGERVVEIPTASLDDLAVTEAKLADLAVATAKIQLLAVDTAQIAALAIETAKIALLAVDTGQLANLAVEAAKIGPLAVETAKIDNLAVVEGKIGALAVTTGKLANDAVTPAKLDPAICYVQLQRMTAQFYNLNGQNDIAWVDLDADTRMAAQGLTVPAGAIAVMLEIYVVDTGAATPTMHTRMDGETDTQQENRVSAQVNGRAIEILVIVPLGPGNIIEFWLQSTAGGASGAFWMRLLGWIIQPV